MDVIETNQKVGEAGAPGRGRGIAKGDWSGGRGSVRMNVCTWGWRIGSKRDKR